MVVYLNDFLNIQSDVECPDCMGKNISFIHSEGELRNVYCDECDNEIKIEGVYL